MACTWSVSGPLTDPLDRRMRRQEAGRTTVTLLGTTPRLRMRHQASYAPSTSLALAYALISVLNVSTSGSMPA